MNDACLAYGAIISVIVSVLKRVPIVKSYPKWTAALLSAASAFILGSPLADGGTFWHVAATVLPCIGATFASAIGFHEVVTKSVTGDGQGTGT